ncbi:MAG: hypothetical protein AB8B56_04040 [Crocinitomicaceae bacterium]
MQEKTEIIIAQAKKLKVSFDLDLIQLALEKTKDFPIELVLYDSSMLSGQFMIRLNGMKSLEVFPLLDVSLFSKGRQERSLSLGSMSLYGIDVASVKSRGKEARGIDYAFLLESEELENVHFEDELHVLIEPQRALSKSTILEVESIELVYLT